ncbi:MAG TPA: FAD-dependent oxidoreductase, partial [Polyangia bacterium]|nr:FAD-dependent oxidoreductase [Polyangia bacterium]
KHAFYFKMRAGMGDIVAAPLFEVLRNRGVVFKFFHRLTGMKVGTDARGRPRIDEVVIEELARVRAQKKYEPLKVVGSLMTWASKPDPESIEPTDYEDACNADRYLYTPRNKPTRHTLNSRDNFDVVILGVPPACLPFTCADLIREGEKIASEEPESTDPRARWASVKNLGTVQTIALQLWFKLSLLDLGWRDSPPLLSLFYDPLNTWCDMSQTLPQEPWPNGVRPGSVAYFCGPLPDVVALPSPAAVRDAPPGDLERLRARFEGQRDGAIQRLLDLLDQLLPNVAGVPGQAPPFFNWSLLMDPEHRKGPDRLESQYRRVNYEPSERCTLALPGQTVTRIPADDTGYENLVVTGDWTRNGIHAACLEGAVQSGIRAARAVSDRPGLYVIKAEQLLNTDVAWAHPNRPTDASRRDGSRAPTAAEKRAEP